MVSKADAALMMQLGCDGGKHTLPISRGLCSFLRFSVRWFGNLLGNLSPCLVYSKLNQPSSSPVTPPSEPVPSSKQ